jgi:hypothetical protein
MVKAKTSETAKPLPQTAPAFPARSRSMPKRRSSSRSLCLALATAIAITAGSAAAAPLTSCKPSNAIYRATTDERYDIEFFRDFGETPGPQKSGVLRYRGRNRVYKYEVWTVWPSGFLQVYIMVKGEKNPEPDQTSWFGVWGAAALSSVMLPLAPDFGFHQNNKTAPSYFVIPDLGQEFQQWPEEQSRHPGEKIIPPDAWKLVRCRG